MAGFSRGKIFLVFIVVLFGIAFSLPNFMNVPYTQKKMNLGLDLQGGSQLLLQLDYDSYRKEQLGYVVGQIREALRSDKLGYKNLGLDSTGTAITFDLRDNDKIDSTKKLLLTNVPDVLVTSENQTFKIAFTPKSEIEQKDKLIKQSIEIIRRRVDETGTKEPSIQSAGADRILLQVPGVDNPEEIKKKINTTAKLTFHLVKGTTPVDSGHLPAAGYTVMKDQQGKYWEVERTPMLTGESLIDAQQGYDQYGNVSVNFKFDHRGGKLFGDLTRDHVGELFASVLDGVVVSAPRISEPILGGSGQITGTFSAAEATNLSNLLRAGALPVSLKILEERTVGASLGNDSIQAGKMASIIAVTLVTIFMVVCYSLFGLFAIVSLTVNILLVIALMSLIGSTLTLPGIAGIALTMGMAVDANVLIYERMREEIRLGKKPYACVEQGFDRAFTTIIDSNITGLISALLLYLYGTGTIRGFAVTLSIGIMSSMFTAIYLTRMQIVFWIFKAKPKTINL